jgi:hypothetical protein
MRLLVKGEMGMKIRKNKTNTNPNPNRRKMTVNVADSEAFKDVQKMLDKALNIIAKQ